MTLKKNPDLHACIVGHSFVRDSQDAIGGTHRILSHQNATVLNASIWFKMKDHYHRVDFFCQSGYNVSMLQRDLTSTGLLYPDVVTIESGSNNLCYWECDIAALMTSLFSYLSMLYEVHGVRLVIMASVLSQGHGPLTRYVKLRVAHAMGIPRTFSPTTEFKGNR